jgi:L-fuculose-phosphate aldolase
MFAVAHQSIPSCIDEFSIFVGGEVRVTEYAASGTEDLGIQAVAALKDRGAALIANHGMVAVGPNPDRVLHITALVERSAHILWGANMLGDLHPLPDEVNANFASVYGFMRTWKG